MISGDSTNDDESRMHSWYELATSSEHWIQQLLSPPVHAAGSTQNASHRRSMSLRAQVPPVHLVKRVWERIAPLQLADRSWDNVSSALLPRLLETTTTLRTHSAALTSSGGDHDGQVLRPLGSSNADLSQSLRYRYRHISRSY